MNMCIMGIDFVCFYDYVIGLSELFRQSRWPFLYFIVLFYLSILVKLTK